MLIGVDLDNTIVCYDAVVHRTALAQRLIPRDVPVCKRAVRDHLRRCGNEEFWVELQGYIYGQGMRDAVPFPGAPEFFAGCADRGIHACIISHRTRYPFRGPGHDLHRAAQEWLEGHGFFDQQRLGLGRERVYLESTRQAKLKRIASLGCTYFIDDLPEFLEDPGFPKGVQRILFDPKGDEQSALNWMHARSWNQIATLLT